MNFIRSFQAICLLLAMSGFLAAQGIATHTPAAQPATHTPAAQQLVKWLAAYDGTNWDAYLKFLKAQFVIQPGPGFQDPALRDRTGGYNLNKIESETSTEVTALLQERATDDFARLVLQVEPAEPHRILTLNVTHIERPAQFALPHMSD